MNEQEHYRLFISIQIPETIRNEMAAVQAELRQELPERGVTWTKPEQLHLTLKFLGNVEAQRVDALAQRLRVASGGLSPLRLRAEGVGAFPDLRFPRVVWIGLKDANEELAQVQRAIEEACGDFTTQQPEGAFKGHVTLGRTKRLSRSEAQNLSGLLDGMSRRFFGEWTAAGIELTRSELSSDGARHRIIEEFKFTCDPKHKPQAEA